MGSRILDFPAASSHVPSVLLDTSVLIYYLEGIEPYSQVYKLFGKKEKQCYSPILHLSDRPNDGGLGGYWKSVGLYVKNEQEVNY